MKAIKSRKKLIFKKQTIAQLSNLEINGVLGGQNADPIPTSLISDCPACYTINICPTDFPTC